MLRTVAFILLLFSFFLADAQSCDTIVKGDTTLISWKYRNGNLQMQYARIKGKHKSIYEEEILWYRNGNIKSYKLTDKAKKITKEIENYSNGQEKSYNEIRGNYKTSRHSNRNGSIPDSRVGMNRQFQLNDSTERRSVHPDLTAYNKSMSKAGLSVEDSIRFQEELKKVNEFRHFMPILKFHQLAENPAQVRVGMSEVVFSKTRSLSQIENENPDLRKLPENNMFDLAHVYREYAASGIILLEIRFEDNYILQGDYDEYYPNGNPRVSGFFYNNLREGNWEYYTEDGELRCIEIYVGGVKQIDPNNKYLCR